MDAPVEMGSSWTSEITTIAEVARDCMLAFQHALESVASLSPREHSMIEDQLARLSLWSTNIGVFALGKMSMDYRMRDVPDIKAVVTGLLEALQYQIQKCPDFTTPNSPQKKVAKEKAGALHKTQLDELDHIVRSIANEISLLYKLSNTIRRASRDSQNEKAATSFKMKDQDEDEKDLEFVLRESFESNISDLFSGISPVLKKRLAATMIVRRKRVLYRRHRLDQLKTLATATQVAQPVIHPLTAQPRIDPVKGPEPRLNVAPVQKTLENVIERNGVAKSQAQSATTLAANKFHQSSPSVVSASETIAIDSHDNLTFPPPPLGYIKRDFKKFKAQLKAERSKRVFEIQQNTVAHDNVGNIPSSWHLEKLVREKEVMSFKVSLREYWKKCNERVVDVFCPFCCCSLSSREVKDYNKWSHHVKNDLDEYVCLFETCDRADEIYRHSTDWLKHMRQHSLRWRCNAKIHPPEIFSKREDYENHLREKHKSTYTAAQLRLLADRNARPLEELFESCPLCGDQPEGGRMEDHIAGHLRFLALKSLPRVEDDVSDTSRGSKSGGGTSRSTVKEDPESGQRPDFVDPHAETAPENITAHDRAGNPYSHWGGFVSYITLYPEGIREKWSRPAPPYSQFFGEPPSLNSVPHDIHGIELIIKDDSRWFVDSSVISDIPLNDLRQFEWGFMPANKAATVEYPDDPVLQAIEESMRQQQALKLTGPNSKRNVDLFTANVLDIVDVKSIEGHLDTINAVAFSPDGKQVVSGSTDKMVRLYDVVTGALLHELKGHSSSVDLVAVSPNGKLVVSGSEDKTVRLWDTVTGVLLQELKGHSDAISAMAFSPDGKQLASGSWDNTILLWDIVTGVLLQDLKGHSDAINAMAFSPDGKQLVSGSRDNTIRLWDIVTVATIQTLEGHSNPVNSVAFSPYSKLVMSVNSGAAQAL
ncbi:hypothetical protein V494_01165 [Pseudogymnoascus sp. VKM F-4513 (FW-928)]|nr:hypothetical protein V494_01165 [Pseudogymnoascus sp. VKM F-4513 (FW-928)]